MSVNALTVSAIYRHPVKSVGAESLETVTLSLGRALSADRLYAVTHGASEFNHDAPAWARCRNFLRVTHCPQLAAAAVAFDPDTHIFTARHADREEITADLTTEVGRAALAEWLGPLAERTQPGPHHVVSVPGRALTDADAEAVSLMSAASLRALSEQMSIPLDPRRFRGNFWIDGDGFAPWAELEWTGREIRLGAARLKVIEPIVRCAATAANPDTGARDVAPTQELSRMFRDHPIGEPVFGMLAEVVQGGEVCVGDSLEH